MLRELSGTDWFLVLVAFTLAIGMGWLGGARRRARREGLRPAPAPPAAVFAASASASPALETLGRYRIEREIGRGSMGVVYLGREPASGARVALKTMALSREFDAAELGDARACFFGEAESARRLHHPDIVAVLEAGEDHGLAFIAMEFIEGHDLQRHALVENLLPVSTVLRMLARAAAALAYAHRQGVVHRDIKPANVMVDVATGTVKITDFGIAHITDASRTRTGLVLGTPCYMSPEQMAGDRVDGRADLYSLGVVLFQLLTGTLPHRATSMGQLMRQIAHEPAPDVRSRRPDLPEPLAALVARALEKRPDARYPDGDAFAADLARAADRHEASAARPGREIDNASIPAETDPPSGFGRADPRHNARH